MVVKSVILVTVLFQFAVIIIAENTNLPSYLKICPKSHPNIKKCLIESVEKLRPLMARGVPELGIPSCEPLVIPEMVINQGHGPVALQSTYKEIEVFGPTEFKIKNIKVDLDKDRVKIKLYLPRLEVNTNYSMNGQILMMPVVGSGQSFGNYSAIEATMSLKAKRIQKNGDIYYHIDDAKVVFDIGHATLRFDNLFKGNKELGDAMNLFLNDNWKTVASEIKPILEEKLADIFTKFANNIFHKYPIKVLFPE